VNADPLVARVEALERQCADIRAEFRAVAHELRQDDEFMRPASQKFAGHVASHWFDIAARRLLWVVLGVFGAAAVGLAMFLAGRGFK